IVPASLRRTGSLTRLVRTGTPCQRHTGAVDAQLHPSRRRRTAGGARHDMTDVQRRILALAFCAIAWAARAHAANELCGQTITQSVTFAADQSCTGTGLIVGADGITIDLAGFTLAGN